MFYDTAMNDHGLPFNPFKSCVIPRPIGWVSTISHDGTVNLAPFSMFNQLGYDPPIVMFSGSCRPGTGQHKDSVTNAEETGEFVVNMATWELRDQVAATSRFVEPDVDEFQVAGLLKPDGFAVQVAEDADCDVEVTVPVQVGRFCAGHASNIIEEYHRCELLISGVFQ